MKKGVYPLRYRLIRVSAAPSRVRRDRVPVRPTHTYTNREQGATMVHVQERPAVPEVGRPRRRHSMIVEPTFERQNEEARRGGSTVSGRFFIDGISHVHVSRPRTHLRSMSIE